MNLLLYSLAYPFILVFKYAPFRVLYLLSDFVYLIVYKIFRYRVKVVGANLNLVFPNKSNKERKAIEKASYKHFFDIFFELIRASTMSIESRKKKFIVTNPELLRKYEDKTIIALLGHYASWEWSLTTRYYCNHDIISAVYTLIENKYFENLIKKCRESFDIKLYERYKIGHEILRNHRKGIKGIYIFVSDQSPMAESKGNYWRHFLGTTVPCFTGFEQLAKKIDSVVLFADIRKIKRGYYKCTYKVITEQPNKEEKYNIVNKFYDTLENQIKQDPKYYMWTHRRWKYHNHPSNPLKDNSSPQG